MIEGQCWCGRPVHNDLLDGCVGDRFLRSMFGPPSVDALIYASILMYGDLVALAADGDEQAAAIIAENPAHEPDIEPDIETDKAMLRAAGMDVSNDAIRSLREHYWPGRIYPEPEGSLNGHS